MNGNPLEKDLKANPTVSEGSGETFYPGPSRIHLAATRYSTGAGAVAATAFTNRA